MKKLLLTMILVTGMTSLALAEPIDLSETVKNIPLKQGIAYSLLDSEFNYLSTIEVLEKYGLTLELGYAGVADNTGHKLVGVLSYPIVKLEQFVNVPILKHVELNIGIYGGFGNLCGKDMFKDDNSNEGDWGISATLLSFQW